MQTAPEASSRACRIARTLSGPADVRSIAELEVESFNPFATERVMAETCPNPKCSAILDDGLVSCPSCGVIPSDWSTARGEEMLALRSEIAGEAAEIVVERNRAWPNLLKRMMGWALAVASLFGFTIWHVDKTVRDLFTEENVQATLERVVEERSDELLRPRVESAVVELQNEFRPSLNRLRKQGDYLGEYSKIDMLQVTATHGRESVAAWNTLRNYTNDDATLEEKAKAAVKEVKRYYSMLAFSSRLPELGMVLGEKAGVTEATSAGQSLEDLFTFLSGEVKLKNPLRAIDAFDRPVGDGLMRTVKFGDSIRSNAAFALHRHRCRESAEKLVSLMRNDPNLSVRRSAAEALSRFTDGRLELKRAIRYEQATHWWAQHGQSIEDSIPPCATDTAPNQPVD